MKHLVVIALALLVAPATQCLAERLADDLNSDQELCGAFGGGDCAVIDAYEDLLFNDIAYTVISLDQLESIRRTRTEPGQYGAAILQPRITSLEQLLDDHDRWIQTPVEPDIATGIVLFIDRLVMLSNTLDSVEHLPPPDWSVHAPTIDIEIASIRLQATLLFVHLGQVTFRPVPEPNGVLCATILVTVCYWRSERKG